MKHPMKNTLSALALISSGILLTGCGGSSSTSTDTGTNTINVSIPFQAVAGSEKIACGKTIANLGVDSTSVKIADFRMFVHDIKLITDQGREIPVSLDASQPSQNSDVVLLDFRDTAEGTSICPENNTVDTAKNPNYNNSVKGSVTIDPAYTVSHIKFTLGVPSELNHANPSELDHENQPKVPEPLRNPGLATGMHWNWQGGYKFTAFDVLPTGGITRPSDSGFLSNKWNIHLGSTGCSVSTTELNEGNEAEACAAPNRAEVILPIGAYNLNNLAIQLNYAAVIANNSLALDEGVKSGCMSFAGDPECKEVFEAFGLPWENNSVVEQTVFSIVDRAEN